MKRLRPPVMMTLVVLVILLAGAACATFRSPDEPLPTRVPTLTASPTFAMTLTPMPTLTLTPTPTFTPPEATRTGR